MNFVYRSGRKYCNCPKAYIKSKKTANNIQQYQLPFPTITVLHY